VTADISARLAAIRATHEAYEASHAHAGAFACCSAHAAADQVPVLLAVARAALAGHEPQQVYEDALDLRGRALCDHDPDAIDSDGRHDESEDGGWICLDKPLPTVCRGCAEVDGERPVWPCEPYKAVAGALGIEIKERADVDA
jgi:hypothetical protein